jgi:hypothetical protein
MTTRIRSPFWLLLLVPVAVACGKVAEDADDGPPSDASSDDSTPAPGAPCGEPDASKPAGDDCNTCTCTPMGWQCTEMVCPEPECEPGDSQADNCTVCTCSDFGMWECAYDLCPIHECETGDSQAYGCTICSCSELGRWDCAHDLCPDPVCEDGDIMDDGCNSCSCSDGQWACTNIACPEPECETGDVRSGGCSTCTCEGGVWVCPDCSADCTPGDEMPAADGCNTCTCNDDQLWLCTEVGCPSQTCGGLAGLTCDGADEYCHYTLDAQCGDGDLTGECQPLPTGCSKEAIPVCGCDGVTYGNACSAHSAGTSVASEGECETP